MLRFGCQTYPWKMAQEDYFGKMPHMLSVAHRAGFKAFESEIDMLGKYFDDPASFKMLLEANQLEFSTLVLHQPWQGTVQTPEEKALSEKAIAFAAQFKNAKIMVSHHAGAEVRPEGEALTARRKNLIACMAEVANCAAEQGIVTCVHPNSSKNSLFKTQEDYAVFFEMLRTTNLCWAPDIGHIVNGGIDPVPLLQAGRDKIVHVHCKDQKPSGDWAVMGEGQIDYPAVFAYLEQTDYKGWLVVEDESPLALTDPDATVLMDGAYFQKQ